MALLGLGYAGFGSDALEDWRQLYYAYRRRASGLVNPVDIAVLRSALTHHTPCPVITAGRGAETQPFASETVTE